MTATAISKPKFGIVAPRLTTALFVGWVVVELPDLARDPRRFLGLVVFGLIVTTVVTVHEAGHFVVGTALGLDLYVRVGPLLGYCATVGDEDESDQEAKLTPAQRIAYAAGGPAANLLSWLVLTLPPTRALIPIEALSVWGRLLDVFCNVSLLLGLFNLLPVSLLDGGRILCAFVEMVAPRKGATLIRVFRFVSAASSGVLALRAVADGDGWFGTVITTAMYVGLGVGAFAVPAPPRPVDNDPERVLSQFVLDDRPLSRRPQPV